MSSAPSDMLVRRCTSFVFNLLKTDLDQWMKARCLHFDDDDEMKLIYTEIYDDFSGVVEEKMNDFVKDEGYSSLRDLAKDMRDAVLSSDRSSLYLNTLLNCLEFEKFVKLMKRKAARMRDETKNHEQKYNGSNDENRDDRRSLEGKHK